MLLRPCPASAGDETSPILPADTSSPRATLFTFIDSCNELYRRIEERHFYDRSSGKDYALAVRILDCLDVSELPSYSRYDIASESAVCLKEILDRVELPPDDQIPDLEAIQSAGGPEKLSQWQVPGTRITIARVEEGPQRHEYVFTTGTVKRAPSYYRDVEFLPYRTTGRPVSKGFYRWFFSAPGHPLMAPVVDRLPEWTRERKFGLTLWKWPGVVVTVLLGIALMAAVYRVHGLAVRRVREKSVFKYCLTIVFPVVAMLIPLACKTVVRRYLTVRGMPLYIFDFGANVAALLAAVPVVFGMCNRIAELIIASPRIQPQGLDAQLIRIIAKLTSLLVAVILFLEGGQYLGIPLTTLLASAGVGGLAVALAAQDTLRNLFGTLMLMADKPFRVGERINVQKYDGVVEEIGLRSTKVRLLTGHQATIPNDELARNDIENVGRRPHIRRVSDIHIPLDTPREKVEKAVAIVRAALENHEGMNPDFPPRVYFNEFNPDSFNIRLIYWYTPPNYWDFLAFSQKFNLEVFRAFEAEGIQFSLPTRVAHTSVESKEKPLDVRLSGDRPTT